MLNDIYEYGGDGAGYLAPSIYAMTDEGTLTLSVDTYVPAGKWDVDEWEAQETHIKVPAGRRTWTEAWRVARAIVKYKKVSLGALCITGLMDIQVGKYHEVTA